jgi:hypothetical protein
MPERFASFPQSIFGKFTYFREQMKMNLIMQKIGSGALALSPETTIYMPLPIPKKLRYERARKFLRDGYEKLEQLGV